MQTWEFELFGGRKEKFYLASEIREYFGRPIYQEDVRQAMRTVKAETSMREQVFKADAMKCRRKVAEMEQVLHVLSRFSDRFPELQREFFIEIP